MAGHRGRGAAAATGADGLVIDASKRLSLTLVEITGGQQHVRPVHLQGSAHHRGRGQIQPGHQSVQQGIGLPLQKYLIRVGQIAQDLERLGEPYGREGVFGLQAGRQRRQRLDRRFR